MSVKWDLGLALSKSNARAASWVVSSLRARSRLSRRAAPSTSLARRARPRARGRTLAAPLQRQSRLVRAGPERVLQLEQHCQAVGEALLTAVRCDAIPVEKLPRPAPSGRATPPATSVGSRRRGRAIARRCTPGQTSWNVRRKRATRSSVGGGTAASASASSGTAGAGAGASSVVPGAVIICVVHRAATRAPRAHGDARVACHTSAYRMTALPPQKKRRSVRVVSVCAPRRR